MKKLFFVSTLFMSFFLSSQVKYTLTKYPMYSKIWEKKYDKIEKDEDGLPLIVFSPKGHDTFGDNSLSFKNVSQTKVQSYLISDLNKFRKDYKKNSISKSSVLTSKSIDDAKNISTVKNYKISKEKNVKIVYDFIPVDFFSRVDVKKYEIEKIIAESVFDWFVANDEGMSLLLSEKRKEFGLGVYISETKGVTIVIRGK
jgi:hypothetical protein